MAGKQVGTIVGSLAVGALALGAAAVTVSDMKQEKKAKVEIQKHYDLMEQKKQVIEYGNVQSYNPILQQNIAFLGFHSRYISAFKNGKFAMKENQIGFNEVFVSIPITAGVEDQSDYRMKVCFRLKGTELYLSATKNGKLELKPHVKGHEIWIVTKNEKQGTFSFKSKFDKWLCAEKNKVVADRKQKKQWERWRIIVVRDPKQSEKEKVVKQPGVKGKEAVVTKGGPPMDQPADVTHAMAKNDGSYY